MSYLGELLQQYAIVDEKVKLGNMTTFRVGGVADYVIYPKNVVALHEIVSILHQNNVPIKVLGKGSNVLCSDNPFHGAIIRLDRFMSDAYFYKEEVVVQAGCSVIALAYDAMRHGLSGLEFACGIPATVGGTTYMNAGAYKSCMADIITEVFVYRDGEFVWMSKEECDFSYRHSIFQNHPNWIVLAVRIKLTACDSNVIRDLMDGRRVRRLETQPLEYPSAGSVFRNPDDGFAWKYIDELGLRGKHIGGAEISKKHSNFIINVDHASAHDVMCLIDEINQKMQQTYGFTMIMEVERFNW